MDTSHNQFQNDDADHDQAEPNHAEGGFDGFDGHQDGNLDASRMHKLLLSTETLQDFLDHLVGMAAADTGHHCGITVGPRTAPDRSYTVASSDELTRQLDEVQYSEGVGPCLEALATSEPVYVPDLAVETRWPDYLRQAAETGIRSSISYPLRNGEVTIGALNVYAVDPIEPRGALQARAAELAAVAAGVLALALRLGERADMIDHLRTALTSRSVIDQAIGIVMAQQRCGPGAAFELLRKASQGRNIKLRDVAAGIVSSVERGSPGAPAG